MSNIERTHMMLRTIVLCIITLFAIIGCTSGSRLDQPNYENFQVGTRGVDITILPNNPPKTILEQNDFIIAIEVRNNGAYEAREGEIAIIGLSPVFNELEQSSYKLESLDGRSFTSPAGEFYIQEFYGQNYMIPKGATEYRTTFLVQADYGYETILNTDVCIAHQLLRVDSNSEVCEVQEKMTFGGQGAPVIVSQVEETVSSRDGGLTTRFKFKVTNGGNGNIISPVYIDEVKLGPQRLQCSKTELTIEEVKGNRGTFECTLFEPARGPYTSTLSALITYRYRTTERGRFSVQP